MLPDLRAASAAVARTGRDERAGALFLLMGIVMSSGVLYRVRNAALLVNSHEQTSRRENPGDTDRGRFPEWIPHQRMR
jgi:hypothetical protein